MSISANAQITLINMSEAYTVLLTNESQQFPTNSSRVPLSNVSYYTDIVVYQGSTERTDYTIGTVSSSNHITVSQTASRVTFTVSTSSTISSDSGTFTIPITIDGQTFNKIFSWSCAKQGATGTSAKSVDIVASSQVFKSIDGGSTFSPDAITLTPVFQGGISYSKWQYSVDGGSTWTDVTSGSHGLTISSGVLSIAKTSDLFTETVTSISFKCISSNSTYYDIMTVLKLYDVTDIEIGVRNLVKNSNFYMGKSKWGIVGVTVNILDDDFYGHVAQIISPNTGSASFRIYTDINSNFSFEIDVLYTISFYAKADSDCNIQTNIAGGTQSVNHALTTAWERYSYTLTASKTGSLTFWSVSAGTTFYITNIQIEHGNKATDWSPAPEDIQNQITTITDTISGVESKVNANTKSITDKVWQTDISTSINEYDGSTVKTIRDRVTSTEKDISGMKTTLSNVQTTVSEKADGSTVQTLSNKVATIESDYNGFKTTVSDTYTTKEEFNDLEIGGRNYVLYGKGNVKNGFFTNFTNVENGYGEHTLSSAKQYAVINLDNGFAFGCRDYEVGKNITWSYDIMYTVWDFPEGATCREWCMGQRYSIDITGSGVTDGEYRVVTYHSLPRVGSNGCELNEWYHVEKIMTIPTQAAEVIGTQNLFQFYNSNADVTATISFRIKNIKLEYGNKATDWTPAPEDVDEEIYSTINTIEATAQSLRSEIINTKEELQSSFEQTSEEINIRVENTETSLQTVINESIPKINKEVDEATSQLQVQID